MSKPAPTPPTPEATCTIPHGSLVVLVGPSGSGKSTWLSKHFSPQSIISSDALRHVVCDDPSSQEANREIFQIFHLLAKARLQQGHTTCLDATHLTSIARKGAREVAAHCGARLIWLVYGTTIEEVRARNARRDRKVPDDVLAKHIAQLNSTISSLSTPLPSETVWHIGDSTVPALIKPSPIEEVSAPNAQVIGDIHGCADDLIRLLRSAGWRLEDLDDRGVPRVVSPPAPGTLLVSVGDLVDRGPDSLRTLRVMERLHSLGHARVVMGNHDDRFLRALRPNNNVNRQHGLAETLESFAAASAEEQDALRMWLASSPLALTVKIPGHPTLRVSHAGIPAGWLQSWPRSKNVVRSRLLYGDKAGIDPTTGLPIRSHAWTEQYPSDGPDLACYGHTPHLEVDARHGTLNLDTGAPFGGSLTLYDTALKQCVSVPTTKHADSLREVGRAAAPFSSQGHADQSARQTPSFRAGKDSADGVAGQRL